jgi:aryl-alcohol dehydrogenase-like predicted oxidoreductase
LLPGTALHVSRLSFGTASLHHLASCARRQDLLAAAYDHGFTHFDTAPYYGFGIAEEALGRFAAARGDTVTVTTKVGLYPPAGARASVASVWLRKAAGRFLPALARPRADWSIAAARASLVLSLRRLRRDHVDFLLLHEPDFANLDSGAFLQWLGHERDRGRIRAFGLAGPCEAVGARIDHPLGQVLQVRDSVERGEADAIVRRGRPLQFTYGYLSGSTNVRETLARALRRNVAGSILVSTRRPAHLHELAAAAAVSENNALHC